MIGSLAIVGAVREPVPKETAKTEMADLLVAYLEQVGVEYVFGVPGGAIEPLFNALARSQRRGGPRLVWRGMKRGRRSWPTATPAKPETWACAAQRADPARPT